MRKRRAIIVFIVGVISLILLAGAMPRMMQESLPVTSTQVNQSPENEPTPGPAQDALEKLAVKGRASKTGYSREQFGNGWDTIQGCTVRNIILNRDLENVTLDESCKVVSGTLMDPYSNEVIQFSSDRSADVQIDHVVALSDAWQKGAQLLSDERREQLANDPIELLAVSGRQNQAKSDADAATWLPKNKSFRCEYVARQIAVKAKYELWVTQAEKDAMTSVLRECPGQLLPTA